MIFVALVYYVHNTYTHNTHKNKYFFLYNVFSSSGMLIRIMIQRNVTLDLFTDKMSHIYLGEKLASSSLLFLSLLRLLEPIF